MEEFEIFVPGRLCLFGEHSDWASEYRKENKKIEKGYTVVATINQGINAIVSKSNRFNFIFKGKKITAKLNEKDLDKQNQNDEFFSCIISTTKYMLKHYNVGGISIEIRNMTLPMGVGLSSSSAICVLVAKAFNKIYNLNISLNEIMDIAYNSERNAGLKCGKMDHVCALNKKLVKMNFDKSIKITEIKNKCELNYVFCIIKEKDTKKILNYLNKSYPNINDNKDRLIQEAFGSDNKDIVIRAIKHIKNGNKEDLGKLMNYAQKLYDKKVFKKNTDFYETCLHEIINNKSVKKLILGAKGVGSHGDGSVQFLVENRKKQEELVKTLHNLGYKSYKLDIY